MVETPDDEAETPLVWHRRGAFLLRTCGDDLGYLYVRGHPGGRTGGGGGVLHHERRAGELTLIVDTAPDQSLFGVEFDGNVGTVLALVDVTDDAALVSFDVAGPTSFAEIGVRFGWARSFAVGVDEIVRIETAEGRLVGIAVRRGSP